MSSRSIATAIVDIVVILSVGYLIGRSSAGDGLADAQDPTAALAERDVYDVRPVAFGLNRLDASTLIDAFGQHPRMDPEPVRVALARIWVSTPYGIEWLESGSSNLVRT
jgi:hypothetical protein